MDRDEFREQMRPCMACGAPCDGDVCDQACADWLDIKARENEEHVFTPAGECPDCGVEPDAVTVVNDHTVQFYCVECEHEVTVIALYCRICGASEPDHRL